MFPESSTHSPTDSSYCTLNSIFSHIRVLIELYLQAWEHWVSPYLEVVYPVNFFAQFGWDHGKSVHFAAYFPVKIVSEHTRGRSEESMKRIKTVDITHRFQKWFVSRVWCSRTEFCLLNSNIKNQCSPMVKEINTTTHANQTKDNRCKATSSLASSCESAFATLAPASSLPS